MKKTLKFLTAFALLGSVFVFTSCDEDAEDIFNPGGNITEDSIDIAVVATGASGNTQTEAISDKTSAIAQVTLEDATGTMRRIYVTENLNGQGEVPFDFSELSKKATKGDGSIDLDGESSDSLNFIFTLPVPSELDGTVEYRFWATSGRGDFRDSEKRKVTEVATIILSKGPNGGSALLTDSIKALEPPLGNGTSNTFVSTLDCSVFNLVELEDAEFWDLGYYYGFTNNASFASPANYPTLFDTDGDGSVDSNVADITGLTEEELHVAYFRLNDGSFDFDGAATSSDLDVLTVSTDDPQRITQLQVGNIVEFIDNYGKKGVIRITAINGTDGSNASIDFDIKIQP